MTDTLRTLRTALGPGTLVTDPDRVAAYATDWSRDPAGEPPMAVALPTSTSEVQSVVAWAAAHRCSVIPRGAGSGLSGGATASADSLVLSLERMKEIRVDRLNRVVVASAGALNAEVKSAAARHGLWYPPDPSSYEFSTIGGNVATNAGGLCCVKYGVTGDYVLGLEVVLADGRLLSLGGPRLKDAAGLSLSKLFVGSEGILGVITQATLRLLPAPNDMSTLVATFPSVAGACEAVLEIVAASRPCTVELMDRVTINAVEDQRRMGLDRSAEALLLVRSDAPGPARGDEIESARSSCERHRATEIYRTDDVVEGEALAAARRSAFQALERLGSGLLLEDVGVPIAALPALAAGIGAVARRHRVTIALVAHAGDGNTHPFISYAREDSSATADAYAAFAEIMELALELDGTITGEHGIGRLKKAWLADCVGADAHALMGLIKSALDPHGLLNPGAVIDGDPEADRPGREGPRRLS